MRVRLVTALLIAFSGLSVQVHAASITIANPSFELPVLADGGGGAATDWSVSGGAGGAYNPVATDFSAIPDGQQVAYSAGATISQELASALAADMTYKLHVAVGRRDLNGLGFANYEIQLLAGGNLLASKSSSDAGAPIPTAGTFVDVGLTYELVGSNASVGQNLEIRLLSDLIPGTPWNAQTSFDDVRLGAVPLPASAILLTSSLIGLQVVTRRRKKSA